MQADKQNNLQKKATDKKVADGKNVGGCLHGSGGGATVTATDPERGDTFEQHRQLCGAEFHLVGVPELSSAVR